MVDVAEAQRQRQDGPAIRRLYRRLAPRARRIPLLAVERRPLRRRRLVDLGFHTKVADIAGNSYLKRVLDEVFERVVLKQRLALGHLDRGKDAWSQHRAILMAIRNRKPEIARREALNHVRISKQLAMLRLQEEAEYLKSLQIVG